MWTNQHIDVLTDPRHKREFSFKVEFNGAVELVRVMDWTRRSKVSTRWNGTEVQMTLAEVPAEVVAQAKVKGQEATTAFHKSCDDLEKWHGTEKVTV